MNIYKLEERVLFEAAAAVEAVNASEHQNHSAADDKNQPESVSREHQAKDSIQNAGPGHNHSGQNAPLSTQKQELPGATAWDQLPEALRGLESHPEHAQQHLPENFAAVLDQFLHGDNGAEKDAPIQFQDLFSEIQTQHRELVILNASVQDTDSIVANLNSNTDVLRLHGGEDALAQINQYLDAQNGVQYDAIHLVSHGNSGFFVLNGKIVDSDSIQSDRAEWAEIGTHLSKDGDLLIYGCSLAESDAGKQLIAELADITGADVAASTDRTGLGGNSELEYRHGIVESISLDFEAYRHSLTAYQVTNNSDSGLGSLRQAILDANTDPGGGEITFSANYNIVIQSELLITDSLTISGTGINRTTIVVEQAGLSAWRAFHVTGGDVVFNDLTIQGGNVTYGAGLYIDGAGSSASLNRVLVENGSATAGGGVYVGGGSAEINNSLIYGNNGSGIYIDGGGSLNLLNSTITGNSGGIDLHNGTGNLANNIIAGNGTDLTVESTSTLNGAYNFYGNISGTLNDLGGNIGGATMSDLFGSAVAQPDTQGRIIPNAVSTAIGNGTLTGNYLSKDVFYDFHSSAWRYIDGSDSSAIVSANVAQYTGDQTASSGMRGTYYVTAGSIDFNLTDASYQTAGAGGNWNNAATWQAQFTYSGGSTGWVPMNNHTPDAGNSTAVTIANGAGVTVTQDVHADQITVAAGGTLTVSSGVNLFLDNGTGNDLSNSGVINVTGTIVQATGAAWNNASGSTVNFNGAAQTINAGTYYNLNLSGGLNTLGGDVTVNGTFTNINSTAGTANLILNGALAGAGTMNMTGGTVTYQNGSQLYSGTYYNLAVAGGAATLSGDIDVVNTFDAGNQSIALNDHILTLGGNTLNLTLLVPGLGTVVYNSSAPQTIAGVTYYNLTLSGGSNSLGGNVTVNGTFTNTNTLTGAYDLTINGSCAGNGAMNLTGGTVTYNTAVNAFGGTYYNFTVGGAAGNTVTAPTAVTVSNILTVNTGTTLTLSAADSAGTCQYQWNRGNSVLNGAVLYSASGTQTILVDDYTGGLQLANGTKQFLAGTYTTGAEIAIDTPSSITLTGAGVGNTILSVTNPGISTNRVLNINNGVLFLYDMHIKGGDVSATGNGGAILSNQGILAMDRVTITDGKAMQGGGIYLGTSTLYIGNTTLLGNTATGSGGGLYFASGSINMVNTTITGNTSGSGGGGLYAGGVSSNITNSILVGNKRSGTADDFYRAQGTYYVTYSMFGAVSGGFVPVTDTNWLNVAAADVFENASPVLNSDGTVHLNTHSIALGNGTRVGGYAQKYVFFDYPSGLWKYLDGSDSSAIVAANVTILTGDALGISGRRGTYYTSVGALDYNIQSAAYQSGADGDWSIASNWQGIFTFGNSTVSDPVLMRNHTPDVTNSTSITIGNTIQLNQNLTAGGIIITPAGNLMVNSGSILTLGNQQGYDLTNNGTLTLTGNIAFSTGAAWIQNTGSTVFYNGAAQTLVPGDYYNLTLGGSGNNTLSGNLHVINRFDAGNQNVVLGANTLTLSGEVTNFTQLQAGTGTVVYDGPQQNIAALTYNNLTLLGGVNYFEAGKQLTVNGIFYIHGTASDLAYINSSVSGTQWILVLGSGATTDMEYTSIRDGNSNRMITLNSNNISGGNNTNWNITVDLSGITGGTINFGDKLGTTHLNGTAVVLGGTVVSGTFTIANPNTLPQVSDSATTQYQYTFKSADPTYIGSSTFTVTVLPRAITATVNAGQGKAYGNTDPTLHYTITSGTLVGADSFSGTLTRAAGETIGTYAVTQGSLALSGNYALTVVPGTFTISPRNITVTIDNLGKIYGNADPALTYQITSGSLVGTDAFTGAIQRAAGENAGTYAVTQGNLALNSNYALTVVPGTFTISLRPIEITGNSGTKIYGNADPVFGYTITNGSLAAGDAVTGNVLRAIGENTGSYQVRQGTLSLNSNYQLTYKPGTFTITPRAIEVTMENAQKVYGNTDPNLLWSITSGNLVGTDSLSGAIARTAGENAGTYTIGQGTLSAGANYQVVYHNGTFTITPRAVTIALDDNSKTYGNADPTLTYSVVRGVVMPGDSFSGAPIRTAGENVGTYTITQGSLTLGSNYVLTTIGNAAFTIYQRDITVAANAVTKTYGNTDPALTYSILSGTLVTGDSFSGAITRTSGENVGTYTIGQGSLTAGSNYNLRFTNSALTITPRAINVTADTLTKTYGDADPALTYTYTGTLAGTDTFSGTLTRNAGSNVGTYTVNQGTLALNSNYTLTFTAGALNIVPRHITITANNVYKGPLDPDPTLTWSVSNLIPGDPYTGALSVNPVTHAISIGTLSYGPNYVADFVSGNVIINLKPILTVTIDAATKIYGNPDPTFTFHIDGLPLNLTYLGTLARANGENVGEYSIYLSSLQIINGTLDVTGTFNISVSSNYLTITPRPITVTPDAGQGKIYDGTASANLTYTYTGVINQDIVNFGGNLTQSGIHVGSYGITQGSLYSANANYSLNVVGGVQYQITPRPIAITADNQSRIYGDADPALTYRITSGSMVSGDGITGALARTAGNNVGSYTILQNTLSAGSDYALTYNSGTLSITPRQLIVTVTPGQSRQYDGTSNANIAYTYSNAAYGDTNLLDGALTQNGVNAGTYRVNAGTLHSINPNYTFRLTTGGTYQIALREITIAADAVSKIYGYTDPDLTWQVTSGNIIAGDIVDGSLSRITGENVGSYAITQGSLHIDYNYNITFAGNNLSISPRSILVTANESGKIYGNTDPLLGYTIASGSLAFTDAFTGSVVRATGENVGIYAVTQGTLALNSNYVLTFVSDTFTITPRAITVTADSKTIVYGDANPALTWQVTSGNLVGTDTLSGALTRTGTNHAGTYTILQGTLSNSNYDITFLSGVYIINQKPITVTADSGQSKIYGNGDPNYTWQITSGALQPGDSLHGSLSRNSGENVGSYTLTRGSLNNSDYVITFVGASFAIQPRPITIAPDAGQGKVYGYSDPSLTWSIVSGNLIGADALSGNVIRAAGENAGSYAITQGSLANSNYAITFQSNNFVISPRPITIGSNSGQSKVYGNSDPTLTWTLLSGSLVAGDTFSGALGRAPGENVGSYSITLGTFSNPNYSIAFFGSKFSITARPITVAAVSGQSKIYGNSNPVLAWEVISGSMITGDILTGSQTRAAGENVGSYSIYRGSLNNSNYAITYVSRNFTVNPRPVTVTPTSGQGKIYGNADQNLTWLITSGNLVGSDSLNGELSRVAGENAGSYAILQNTLANANYTITFVSNNYTISPRPIAVGAVAGQGKIYGNADPAFQWKLLNGNFIGSDTLTGTLSRDAGENVASYAFHIGTLANANYAVTFVDGNPFVISARAVTVTANSGQGKVYGNSDPASLTWQITSGSLVSGDTLTGVLIRATGENVGSYLISQGTLNNTNYAITYVSANFAVSQRPLTVTADSGKTKVYGYSDPAFTWQITSGNLVGSDALSGTLGRIPGENVGSYAITQGTLANSNYAITFVGNPMTITARPITVTPDGGQTKIYGNNDPALTWQVTSGALVSGDTLSGALTRNAGLNVGNYAITQGTLNNSNYQITFTSGVQFSITPRSITVSPASGQSKVYGNTDPTLTWIVTSGSLAYSDTLSGAMTRDAGQNVGAYSIHQGTLAASSNYNMNFQENSATFAITARPITVTADAKTKTYGDSDPALTYQITSGSLVSGDTLTGSIVRATGENVGTYTISKGTLAASSNYTLTFVNANFTIARKPVTVTANSGQTKVYGDSDPTPYGWTITSGSLVGSDSLSGNLSRVAGSNVGSYNLTQGTLTNTNNPNYSITFVSKTFTITARPISITPDSGQTKVYGNNDPTLTWHLTSGNMIGADTLSGAMTRDAGQNVGTYTIRQGTLANSNYAITFQTGPTFAITARPITVTPTSGQSKIYGNTDPAFTWTLTGGTSLAYTDTLTGAMTRAAGENVGSYAITQGTLAASSNYTMTFVNGSFAVTPRPITVAPTTGQSKVYGSADPAGFTWTLTSGNLIGSDSLTGAMTRDSGENVGSYTIRQGTLAASSNYTMTFVNGSFAVMPKPITVTVNGGQTKIYGNSDPLPFTYQTTGLVGSDALNGALSRNAGENVGSYAITQGTLANSNYTITFISSNFTITPRAITITPDSGQNKVYGNSDPTLTWHLVSGNIISGDLFTGALTRDAGQNVGYYTITQGTLTNTNYTITFLTGPMFQITPRPITVTADSGQTKIYGNGDPVFTYHITSGSLAYSDTLSGALGRAAGENVGSYAITQGSLTASTNYTMTYASSNFNITPRPITVAPVTGQNKVYGNTDPTLNWQITNGSLVGSDSLTGTIVRAAGENVGSYAITQGTLSASSNYTLTFNNGSFAITPKPITVTANSGQTKVYGNSDPSFTWQITSGALVGSDSLSGALTRIAGENVGSYAIQQGTLANSNYAITFVGSNFAITARPITVTADAGQTKIYGNSDPTLTYHITSGSLVGSDTLTGTMTRTAGENVGSYAIQKGSLANTNYTITFVSNNFSITPRAITVMANSGQSKIYGNSDSTLTWHISSGSLVGSDSLSGALTRAAGENVGSYAIQQGSLANTNYTITFVSSNFAITARPITVTADSGQTKVYGNSDPTLTWHLTSGSLVGSDTLSGALTRAAGENVGFYAIQQGTLANSNYSITFVSSNFAITARPITVTANSGQSKIYGSSDPTLAWQITSGSLAGSDSLSGTLARAAGENVGSYAIQQGTLSASSNYSLTYVSSQFAITPKPITVTANSLQSKVYGNSDPMLTWQITSGSLVGSDALSGALARAAGDNVGSYAINQGSLANSNYAITFVGSNFTITARPITVTANIGQGKTYGYSDPALAWQITTGSLVGSDAITGALVRAAGENVGSYAINQGTLAASSNYALTYISNNFTISPRPITVTPDNGQNKTYGNSDPTLTWQITNGSLVGSDTLSGSLGRTAGENAGIYSILQGSLANSNYAITFTGGRNFTINQAPITVTADSGQTKIYGNSDPALTYHITSGALVGSDTLAGSLARAVGENVGSYAIAQGSLNNANYLITYVGANFAITARPVTVTANGGQGKIYGNGDPSLTYSITSGSLASGDSFSGTLTRAAGENVGSYAIAQGSLTLGSNYTLTYIGANFAVSPRPITVASDTSLGKIYGNSDPSLTWQITSGSLAFSDSYTGGLTRIAGENVGSYAVTQGTLSFGANYAVTFVNNGFSITPRAIAVTADNGGKIYGNTDPSLTYHITSGSLAFSDSFTGSLVRNSGENVGSYAVTQGTLTLGSNYSLTFTGATFAVTQRAVTVTIDSTGKVYGNADPTFTYQITNGSLAFSDSFTGNIVRIAGEDVGVYAMNQGTLALNSNYTLTVVPGSFTITPRAVTVTGDTLTKIYGDTDPALTYQITNGSLAFSDSFTGSLTRDAGTNVGVYAVTQGNLTLGSNYTLTYLNGQLSIGKRDITITADAKAKTESQSDPALTWTVTNLAAGDTSTGALTRQPGEAPGTYAIEQGTLTYGSNYNETFVGALLTINQKVTVNITIDAQSKVYGTSDPAAYTFAVTGLTSGYTYTSALNRAAGENVGSYLISMTDFQIYNSHGDNDTSLFNINVTNNYLAITPATITVTPDAGQSKVYDGTASINLSYSWSGALPGDTVTFSGSLSQNGIHTGSYEIGLGTLQSLNPNYQISFVGGVNMSITQRAIGIRADGQTKIYGDADPNLTYTVISGSVVAGDSFTGSLNRDPGNPVGSYLIHQNTLSLGSDYQITFTEGILSITPRTVTITADPGQMRQYDGTSDAAITYTYSNTAYGDTGFLIGALAQNGVDAGTHGINLGTLSSASANYTLVLASGGTYQITPRQITVTADAGQNKIYGNSDPNFTWALTGGSIISGDTSSGSLSRDVGENAGLYAIQQGTLSYGSNYAITFVSNNFQINTRAIQVTADTQTKVYGDSDPALSYTITQGTLAGSDSFSGALSRDVGENVGTYAVHQGTLNLSANYTLTFVDGNLSITPRTISVAANAGQNKIYGSSDPVLAWNLVSGSLVTGDTLSGALTRAPGEDVGSYSISQGSLANPNYAITFVGGVDFAITPRAISVTADAGQSKTYGNADPAFTWQITAGSLVGSDTLSGALTRATGENVGAYAIQQGTLNNSNYQITFNSNDFAITARSITVSPDAGQSKTYGDADGTIQWTITSGSLVPGDAVTGTLSRDIGENAGNYNVTIGSLTAGSNYAITLAAGTYAVTPRNITVESTVGLGKTYGNADSALSYQITAGSLVTGDTFAGALIRQSGENVGNYDIAQGTLTLGANYNMTYVNNGFAISARTIQVTADNASKTYGDADSALTYQITSGSLAFSDSFTGSLSRDAGENVGTYTIGQGSLALNANYILTVNSGSFQIAQRNIQVTADTQNKIYGNTDPALTYQITSGSLAFSDTISGTLNRAIGEDVGTYTILQGSLALNANYNLTFVQGALNITARQISVTADAQTKTYGDADPVLTYQITSGSLAFSDTFSGTLNRMAGENAGSYDIQQGSLALNTNYVLTFTGSQMTIGRRDIVVTADAKAKTDGQTDPVLTWTVGNLVPGDTATGTLERDPGEAVGIYAIRQGSLSYGDNYNMTFVGNSFEINMKQTITVTFDAQSKVYGTADPNFTFRVSGLASGNTWTSVTGRDSGENVGAYTLRMNDFQIFNSQGDNTTSLYNINVVSTFLTITPATITVTPDGGQGKIYDGTSASGNLTYTYSGVLPGDTVIFGGSLAQSGIDVGDYQIGAGSLYSTNGNYQLAVAPGTTYHISPRQITVTGNNLQSIYGDADPSLTYTVTSGTLADGDSFTGALTRDPGIHVGDYAITQGTLALGNNYDLTYVNGTLSVTPRTVTIIVTPGQSREYDGTSDANISYTYTNTAYGDTNFLAGALTQSGINAGTYQVQMGTLSSTSADYTLVLAYGGSYTVTPRAIGITANDLSIIYGCCTPITTWQLTSGSLVAGDSISGALSRDPGSDVGTYGITQGTLTAGGNYQIAFTQGTLTITPRAITVGADSGSKIYGDNDPNFTYRILTGSLAGSDSFSGALVRDAGENVGNYTIHQGSLTLGNNYTLTFVENSFAVTPRVITVTAADGQGKNYGDADGTLQWQVTAGNLVGLDTLNGTLGRDAGENVGTYAINAGTLGNPNYVVTFQSGGSFTIVPRAITVTVNEGQNKVYGDADPNLGWHVSQGSLVGSDTLGGALSRDAGENAGSYAITQGTLSNSNYAITFAGGNLTITPRALTISGDAGQSKVYGEANPNYTWTLVSGQLIGGDTLTGTLGRVSGENVGSYAFTQGTLGNPNYSLTLTGVNTFAVTPRYITIAANDVSRPFGQSDPALTYTIVSGSLAQGDQFSGSLARQGGESAGIYLIYQNTLGINSNYVITYIPGTFTITPAQNFGLNYYQEYVNNNVLIRREEIRQDEAYYNHLADRQAPSLNQEPAIERIRPDTTVPALFPELNEIMLPEGMNSNLEFNGKAEIFKTIFDKTLEKLLIFT